MFCPCSDFGLGGGSCSCNATESAIESVTEIAMGSAMENAIANKAIGGPLRGWRDTKGMEGSWRAAWVKGGEGDCGDRGR